MNYYQKHIGDFNSATRHLTRIERSIYSDLIELYYDTEAPLVDDKKILARKILATTKTEVEAIQNILDEFFVLQDDGKWHNKRCDAEIAAFQQKSSKAKASANARWKPDSSNANLDKPQCERIPNAMRTHTERNANQEPITSNHKPITNNQLKAIAQKPENPLDGFEEFWQAYPRKTDRKKAESAWAKIKPDEQTQKTMLNTIAAWSQKWLAEPQFTPHPTTWLNGERWNDAPPPVAIKTAGTRTIDTRPLALRQLDELQANEAQHHNMIEVHS